MKKITIHIGAEYHRVFRGRKDLGIIWFNGPGDWECENSVTGMTWGSIDTLEDAIEILVNSHN